MNRNCADDIWESTVAVRRRWTREDGNQDSVEVRVSDSALGRHAAACESDESGESAAEEPNGGRDRHCCDIKRGIERMDASLPQ